MSLTIYYPWTMQNTLMNERGVKQNASNIKKIINLLLNSCGFWIGSGTHFAVVVHMLSKRHAQLKLQRRRKLHYLSELNADEFSKRIGLSEHHQHKLTALKGD